MNISNVSVRLTEEDILGIVKEYVKIKEICIENISIKESIYIKGKIIKGIKINFEIRAVVHRIDNNVLSLKIINIKLGKMPIAVSLASFALKIALKSIEPMGITLNSGFLYIDFKKLCTFIPGVRFILMHIITLKGVIEVELKDLVYSESKQALSLSELKEQIADAEGHKALTSSKIKTEDKYTEIREDIKEAVPEKLKDFSEYLLVLPDLISLLYRLMKDSRVPTKTKLIIGGVITYFVVPSDLIPDFIPLVGKGDDFGIAFLALDKIIKDIPKEIVLEHWQGKEEFVHKIIDINDGLTESVGSKNTVRIFSGAIVFLKRKKRK